MERIDQEIEKTREKIAEYQEKLKTLEAQKTEAENLEIVQMVRALRMTPAQLNAKAKSDGSVCSEEIAALKEVAQCMELSPKEVESMLNLSGNSLEEAYKVLEIDPSATNEEVRTAYRRLALKHHPDRVATLGEDVKKAAEEKFQQINNAKERIYKARGIK